MGNVPKWTPEREAECERILETARARYASKTPQEWREYWIAQSAEILQGERALAQTLQREKTMRKLRSKKA